VSAELSVIENAELYETVTKCLLHEPCGPGYPNALCIVNGMCKKRYPRKYSEATTQGEDSYAMMGEHSKKIRVDLYLTIDGWYRTTPI
jgi:hypothetical protein